MSAVPTIPPVPAGISAADFLRQLEELRIRVQAEDGRLRITAPAGTLTPELRAAITGRKPELLRFLAESPPTRAPAAADAIVRLDRGEPIPASYAQKSLWLFQQLQPHSSAYNIPGVLRLRGTLDVAVLARSLTELVRRHEALRTSFDSRHGEPVQVVHAPWVVELPLTDLTNMPADERAIVLKRQLDEEAQRPFDLERGPLFRPRLWRVAPDEHVLQLNVHHIVFDGWSFQVLLAELAKLYPAGGSASQAGMPDPALQFADYAAWQHRWMAGDACAVHAAFWKKLLAGAPGLLELPADRPRPARATHRGLHRSRALTPALVAALHNMRRNERTTLFTILFAAFHVLLHRYTNQQEIVVGMPVANRTREAVESMIGFFVNVLPIRISIGAGARFRDLLREVQRTTLDAFAHQEIPFDKIVEELNPPRSASYSPVFQVLFSHQNVRHAAMELTGLSLEWMRAESASAKYDLSFYITEEDGRVTAGAEFNSDLFEAATIERWLANYEELLRGIAADAGGTIAELPLLAEAERRQVVEQWNDTATPDSPDVGVPQLIEAQVARTPEAVALVLGDQRVTYADLDRQANQLARHLRGLGAGPEVLVGVCLPRNVDLIVALLAVHKAGGAYVPLDPNYPADRLAYILEDAAAPVLVTHSTLASLFSGAGESSGGGTRTLVCIDSDAEVIAQARGDDAAQDGVILVPRNRSRSLPRTENEKENEERERLRMTLTCDAATTARPENLSHVIYTSGSTGRPKGVAIEHRNVSALMRWARRVYSDSELAGVLASTSVCFDLSVFEIFAPLCWGGAVHLAANALELPTLAATGEITLVNTVPSAIAELLRSGGIPESVSVLNLAGEPLPRELVDQLYARPHIRKIYDLYGPTEDTVYSTFALREAGAPATIGRPLANKQVYLLDDHRQPVPLGVPGEVWLGGDGVTRGYLGRPELTAERFIPDPFRREPGARLYKTGDLARYRADGNLEFLGRLDHQIKLRGFRIELGEIESVLRTHPDVADAVVVAREDVPGARRLVAYVVDKPGTSPSARALLDFLGSRLPEYMAPAAFVTLERLPLTPNGKVDRKALPAPDDTALATAGDFVAPRTPVETAVADIWRDLLGAERVGIHDNFFDLGGHSLLAMRAVAQIGKATGGKLPVRWLFDCPTIATLAARIEGSPAAASREPIVAAARSAPMPLSHEEQRLWFLHQTLPDPSTYNVPWAARLRGPLDVDRLRDAFTVVMERHEILRTGFVEDGGVPARVIAPEVPVPLEVREESPDANEPVKTQVDKFVAAEAARAFTLDLPPLFHAACLRLAADDHVIVINAHHIICDEWSLQLLRHEIEAAYAANGSSAPESGAIRNDGLELVRGAHASRV
ncbi:MAG: amino acid adenylation domain-containing protein, partial [Opitutaceae bacterium]